MTPSPRGLFGPKPESVEAVSFATSYRPRTFEEVRGQPHPVRFLSGLIRHGQRGRSILLHGAIGSGKTSLVRIYAQALNCDCPTSEGSPCLQCPPCTAKVGLHEYDTSGRGGAEKHVVDWVTAHNVPPHKRRWTILFFDEAQALTRKAADAILKAVEEPALGVVFCFATTEFERIRPALRSRLIGFEIKPLSAAEAIRLLKDCASTEGIQHAPGALELLSGLGQGYPRDLLNGLEKVRDLHNHPITVTRVREVFDVDHTDRLLNYARSLAAGELTAQNEAWRSWHEVSATKISWLKALLTGVYYNDVLGQELIVDALIASILAPERAPILQGFKDRLGVTSAVELAPYWRAMMMWLAPVVDVDETALELRIALFHYFVNDELPRLASSSRASTEHKLSIVTAQAVPAALTNIPSGQQSNFPSIEDVRKIIASASYLMQEHKLLFNAHIVLEPALMGVEREADAVALVATFCQELEARVAIWISEPLAYICLLERDLKRGGEVAGRILVHLPELHGSGQPLDVIGRVMSWAQSWRGEAWLPGYDAVMVKTALKKKGGSLKFHWDNVLDLCAGIHEEVTAWDPLRNSFAPLRELLQITKERWRTVGGIAAPIVRQSEMLSPATIAHACANGMSLLSAFDVGRWDLIRSGWELEEHVDRRETKIVRAEALKRIADVYADANDARNQHDELIASWQGPPEERQRHWRGWWLPTDI